MRVGNSSSPSLSIKIALIVSLSLTSPYPTTASPTTSSSSYFSYSVPRFFLSKPKRSSTPPKATTSNLLSLLGTHQQASSVNPEIAHQLRSCFKFLVPFSSPTTKSSATWPSSLRLSHSISTNKREEEDNELVWWPPTPVLELARLAVDSGGDPGSIHRALDPTPIPVPDVEGSNEDRCHLTRTPYGRLFINEEVNSYLKFLFEIIATRGPNVGLPVSFNRYDFFHGHLFIAKDGRLGILFHAKEYPAYDKEVFPYNMGFCQVGSNVTYGDSMNLRNILWLAPLPSNSSNAWLAPGVLVVLDARPGGIIYRDLIPEYVDFVRTLYEEDFGDVVVDVNYLNIGGAGPAYQIFIC